MIMTNLTKLEKEPSFLLVLIQGAIHLRSKLIGNLSHYAILHVRSYHQKQVLFLLPKFCNKNISYMRYYTVGIYESYFVSSATLM